MWRVETRLTAALIVPLVAACSMTTSAPATKIAGVAAEPVSSGTGQDAPAPLPAHGLQLPATFRGDLPCADCAGVRHQLDLWPDQVFHLRREWLGKGLVRSGVGRWRVDPGRRALILEGGAEMPLQLEIRGRDRLRQLDLDGKPIVSDLPYELRSGGAFEPVAVSLLLGGEMTYLADSARFTECLTGRNYPLVPGAEALHLERAYLANAGEPGAPLYVTFDGTITKRPAMEGDRIENAVTVDRFVGVWPNQRCERARADASLVNTYWRFVQMKGNAVKVAPERREPHLLLRQTGERPGFAATVGCNQLVGAFAATDRELSFGQGATTLMACPPPLDEMEKTLAEVLVAVRRWQIRGSTLTLQDQAGNILALLEAVYF